MLCNLQGYSTFSGRCTRRPIGADDVSSRGNPPDRGDRAPAHYQCATEYDRPLDNREQPGREKDVLQPDDKHIVHQIHAICVALNGVQYLRDGGYAPAGSPARPDLDGAAPLVRRLKPRLTAPVCHVEAPIDDFLLPLR